MNISQFMKWKSISDSRIVENISDKILRIEVQPALANGLERAKHFVNVHLHCIVINPKRIRKISMFSRLEKLLLTSMDALISI